MKKSELRQIIREELQNLNEVKLKMPKSADEATDQAMEWQREFSNKSMSWEEVMDAGHHFEKVAKKFKLTDEFRENGII